MKYSHEIKTANLKLIIVSYLKMPKIHSFSFYKILLDKTITRSRRTTKRLLKYYYFVKNFSI